MPSVMSAEWPSDGFDREKLRLEAGQLVDQVWEEAAAWASPEEHVRLRGVAYNLATKLFISGRIAARPSPEALEQVIAAALERFQGISGESRGIAEAVMDLLEGPQHEGLMFGSSEEAADYMNSRRRGGRMGPSTYGWE